MIKNFTDLEAWKEAHKLTLLIYKATKLFPESELFGLTSQLRRAAVSVESCIAEGFTRYHYKDRMNFIMMQGARLPKLKAKRSRLSI